MKVLQFKALTDNYNFIAYCESSKECIGVDIFDSEKFISLIEEYDLKPVAIVNTHHHSDHIGGNKSISNKYPNLKFYASEYDFNNKRISNQTNIAKEGDVVKFGDQYLKVLDIAGHTLGHIAYYNENAIFVGDTIFVSGCGRVFEGTHKQMFEAIKKITQFTNKNTEIYCGHEYTLSNVNFAYSLNNKYFEKYKEEIEEKRKKKIPTVPTTLNLEYKFNPFVMVLNDDLRKNILGLDVNAEEAFSILRSKKDVF